MEQRNLYPGKVDKVLYMDTLVRGHSAIMDQYDPDKKIGLSVDEWGTWFDGEPGTNPGFLYQQNTIRDALVAGINLNIFNKHCDRVKMANIAQLVNVLQSVILTDGDRMVKTPTWHVFYLFQKHQGADLVESSLETKEIGLDEEELIPNMNESVSLDKDGKLQITITNASLDEDYPVELVLMEGKISKVTGEIVTGAMRDYNTFDQPDCVAFKSFDGAAITEKGLTFTVPARSVLHLEAELA